MADDGGEVAMAPCLYTQNAEAGLSVVERNPLDDASEHFAVGLI